MQAAIQVFHIYDRSMVAIFDALLPLISRIIRVCHTVFLDPKNMGIAIGFFLILCVRAKILHHLERRRYTPPLFHVHPGEGPVHDRARYSKNAKMLG